MRGLGYINKDETPNGKTIFVKGKKETLTKQHLLALYHYAHTTRKIRHTQYRCYTKFLERFESQMSRLMNDF